MRLSLFKRHTFNYYLLATLVLAQAIGLLALPKAAAAAISADPNGEIVYIDNNGFIRVLDTQGDPLVQWVSPTGGWDDVALGDVNDDTDLEIIAMNRDGDFVNIGVFDPVVAQGSLTPDQKINGIPWETYFETRIEGDGQFILADNFDDNIPGDEFAVGVQNDSGSFIQVWNANSLGSNGKPTGRDWKVHVEKEFPESYTFGIAGQLDGEGAVELVLFDDDSVETGMDVYRTENDFERLDGKSSDNDSYKKGAIGQIIADGNEELATILSVSRPDKDSLIVYEVDDSNELQVDESWAFAPQPDWVFLADIQGNGDKEVFFLRNYPDEQEGPRLIMRDDWGNDRERNEDLIEWNLMEGGDRNEFRRGTGGDVDGDGKEEVVIIRDDRIRLFHRPENGQEREADYTDYEFDTNRDTIVIGDLDTIGFAEGPIFATDKVLIDAVVPAGTTSGEFTVQVTNISTAEGVTFNAVVPFGNSWVQLNSAVATTPATLRLRFNAVGLTQGIYQTTLTLTSQQQNVLNEPYVITLRLTVVPPELQPNPGVVSHFILPCASSTCTPEEIEARTEPFTQTIEVRGTNDLTYRAAIIGVPTQSDGAAAASSGGLLGSITGGEIDANGNMVLYDEQGNSRTIPAGTGVQGEARSGDVSIAAVLSNTWMIDPELTWISSLTSDTNAVPSTLTFTIDPSVVTEVGQREYAVLVLVADTRAGAPTQNVVLVPIEVARVNNLLWLTTLKK
jgi:hypothetical protein